MKTPNLLFTPTLGEYSKRLVLTPSGYILLFLLKAVHVENKLS